MPDRREESGTGEAYYDAPGPAPRRPRGILIALSLRISGKIVRWRSLLSVLLLGACTFELDPLVTGSDAGSSGGSSATGGTSDDASCVTVGCNSGGNAAVGTGAASGGGVGGSPPGGGSGPGGGGVPAGGTTSGGSGGVGAGGAGTGGTGAGGGGVGASGGTSGFACTNISQLPDCSFPNQTLCICQGCDPIFCTDPIFGDPISDCVCPSCWNDPDCSGSKYCVNDGLCDPFGEGCDCVDCYDHPACF